MALFRRSSSDAHWSKDYIEHLRSVHFVLIAVAVTCIAVSRTPDIAQLERAKTEIHEILDVGPMEEPPGSLVTFSVQDKTYFAELQTIPAIVQSCDGNNKLTDNWMTINSWATRVSKAANLASFIGEWNDFRCKGNQPDRLLEVDIHDDDFAKEYFFERDSTDFVTGVVTVVGRERVGLLQTQHAQQLSFNLTAESPFTDESGIPEKVSELVSRFRRSNQDARMTHGFAVAQIFDPPYYRRVVIPIRFHPTPTTGSDPYFARQAYMRQKIDDWECHDVFKTCFPDLNAVAKNRTGYALKNIADFIDAEVAGQSRDVEIVGIKFPKEDLTRWGIVLLCCILAYMWLHLRELSPKISSSDEGLDVAWLGLYSSRYAWFLLWLSILVVPSVAVVALGVRGANFDPFAPLSQGGFWSRVLLWLKVQPWAALGIWVLAPTTFCATLGILSCLSAMKLAKLADTARNSPEAESATDLRSMD